MHKIGVARLFAVIDTEVMLSGLPAGCCLRLRCISIRRQPAIRNVLQQTPHTYASLGACCTDVGGSPSKVRICMVSI